MANLVRGLILALPIIGVAILGAASAAETLDLPPRPTDAPTAKQILEKIAPLDLVEREKEVTRQILAGNIPDFLRQLSPVTVTNISTHVAGQQPGSATFFVTPDYLAVGSDDDNFLTPLSPQTAQTIADALKCSLPTRKMVNDIYRTAVVKLEPSPIPPSPAMTTVPVFSNHNAMVYAQRATHLKDQPLGALVAGHKKDVVITPQLTNAPEKVAIYGWHQTNGKPIQPLYLGHTSTWVDYSQCIRLVSQHVILNGRPTTLASALADPSLADFFSDEGPLLSPRYSTNPPAPSRPDSSDRSGLTSSVVSGFTGFTPAHYFGELIATFTIAPEVKVHINLPGPAALVDAKPLGPTTLVFYALPNGNTTAQTIGKKLLPGDDWHFDIQHIGAQTRFLRNLLKDEGRTVIIAYLESANKSWPAWRKAHGDKLIPEILTTIKHLCATNMMTNGTNRSKKTEIEAETQMEVVLSSHSGGGSFIFGYLNAIDAIPDDIVRISFLDSDYAYDSARQHDKKLAAWLEAEKKHYLCVLAYDDANALLNGKSFVSAEGGTWGRSHALQADLAKSGSMNQKVPFSMITNGGFEQCIALDKRVQFLLRQNPERRILHTVQVEKNGFIHSMVTGTTNENRGYTYFGERAYSQFIVSEPEQE